MTSTRARTKYGNHRVTVAGRIFDSKAESRHYEMLVQRERLGEIRDLRCQVAIPLVVNSVKVGVYRADFSYWDVALGREVVVDVKGVRTPVYRLKAKLVKALHGIKILEISA